MFYKSNKNSFEFFFAWKLKKLIKSFSSYTKISIKKKNISNQQKKCQFELGIEHKICLRLYFPVPLTERKFHKEKKAKIQINKLWMK